MGGRGSSGGSGGGGNSPFAMQIYNQYRKHWLAAYWQLNGITVYPTISWSDENSYEWCFDGEPRGGASSP